MTKVALLTGTNSRNAGGLFNSVKSLAKSIVAADDALDLSVISHNDEYTEEDLASWGDLKMPIYNVIGPKNFAYSKDLKGVLKSNNPDIIHQQGIWTYASHCALAQKRQSHTKTIITPRGMLDPWAINNSKLKKKLVGHWFEYANLKGADCIHALCESEYQSIRNLGLKNPVAIIPNGIYLPEDLEIKQKHHIKGVEDKKVLLFISRVHPKKGLEFSLEVFKNIQETAPHLLSNWEFRIAGWSQNGHQEALEEKCKEYKLSNFVKFIGPVYGEAKEKELLHADAFILPSYSEGLPMSVLEAWSYKLPVLMTPECNIPEGFENEASIQINHNLEHTTKIIKQVLNSEYDLTRYGENGYNLVKNKFTWGNIANQTLSLYHWLLNPNEIPDFIKLD
ncbi:glycosyltransferase [Winogradskyella psychrotolerans]|uniref:glycosyltransferase n=1 Tax=Winogradskyella psychrotolerans TaxID=1344585 RepID=UPI001C069AC5|nr:glycosyltransferase [Winogradskyella psychrotolerans]MBU2927578.1 glycosyltransferase [Winogradskyella psychrotolerans]